MLFPIDHFSCITLLMNYETKDIRKTANLCLVTYRNNLLITDMLNRQDGGSMPRASYYRMLIRMMDVFTNDGMRFSVQNPQSLNHFDQSIFIIRFFPNRTE